MKSQTRLGTEQEAKRGACPRSVSASILPSTFLTPAMWKAEYWALETRKEVPVQQDLATVALRLGNVLSDGLRA